MFYVSNTDEIYQFKDFLFLFRLLVLIKKYFYVIFVHFPFEELLINQSNNV